MCIRDSYRRDFRAVALSLCREKGCKGDYRAKSYIRRIRWCGSSGDTDILKFIYLWKNRSMGYLRRYSDEHIRNQERNYCKVSFGVYFDNDRTYRHRIFLFVHFYLRWALSNLYHLIYKFYF